MKGRIVGRCADEKFKEGILTIIKIIDAFTFYGIDVVLLGALTAIVTQLLKISVFKKVKKKLLTFLPFILGTLFYAVYACVRDLSIQLLLTDYVQIIEHGISVGAVATLAYVLHEQFVREKTGTSQTEQIIATLLEGYVPTDSVEKAAKEVAAAIERDVTGNGAARAEEIIASYSEGEINERDIKLLTKLIIETLAHITAS